MIRTALIAVALSSMVLVSTGCTTTRSLTPQKHSRKLASLEAGDQIVAYLIDDSRVALTVTSADDERLVGKTPRGAERTLAWDEIRRVEIVQVSAGRTALLVGGTAAAVYIVVAAITAAGVAAIFAGAN